MTEPVADAKKPRKSPESVDSGKVVVLRTPRSARSRRRSTMGKSEGREKKYSKKWKYGSYPVALANAIALATAAGAPRGFRRCVPNTFAGSGTIAGGR